MLKILCSVLDWCGLMLARSIIFGLAIPFAIVGLMVCLPNREFRKDLLTRGDNGPC